ncbi:MAG TPA: DUF6603 domain-containing protein [Pyrinomonadaceae bacterium]
MDLNNIAETLRKQASINSTLVFDQTVLSDQVRSEVRTAFLLPADKDLTITGVAATAIPDPKDGVLTIPPGIGSVLNKSEVTVGVALTQQKSEDPIQVLITATLSDWQFTDTFEDLDLFPFPDLNISDPHFVYTSVEQDDFFWPGDVSVRIHLAPGLNFLSKVTLNFPVISQLLKDLNVQQSFEFYGPFAPTQGQQLPVGELKAPLGLEPFAVGVEPFMVTLSNPAVAVRIGTADSENPLQRVDLVILADINETLEFSVGLPMTGSALAVSTKPLPHNDSINSLIESLPGGKNFESYIPTEIKNDIFAEVGLDNFSMIFDYAETKVTYLGLSIGTLKPWPLITGELELNSLKLQLQTIDPAGMNWMRVFIKAIATFKGKLAQVFKNGEFDFTVGLEKQTSWEIATISGVYFGSINLGDIVGGFLGNQDSVPSVLREFHFSNFGMSVTRSSPGAEFTYSIFGSAEVAFPISGNDLTAELSLSVTKTPSSYEILLTGQLVIGAEAFSLNLDLGSAGSKLSASWKVTGAPLEFEDIAHAFGFDDVPTIPTGLDLNLVGASFSYDFTNKLLVLTAESKTYGDAVFIADTSQAGSALYAFGLVVPVSINFADVPVVGSKFPDAKDIGISEPGVWIFSRGVSKDECKKINGYIEEAQKSVHPDQKLPVLPTDEDLADVLLSATLELGPSITYPLRIPLGSTKATPSETHALANTEIAAAAPSEPPKDDGVTSPTTSPDGATWKEINKSVGPLTVQRLGLKYANGELYFLIELGFSAGGLTIDLAGLGVSSKLTAITDPADFVPHFHLSGLEIEYKASGFEIAGEFLNMQLQDPDFEYAGTASLQAGEFNLTAIGSYARISGQTSLFVFAVIEYPLGGPPFFFITGAAAGFGFNRNLVLPEVDDVPNFPLVAAAVNPSAVFPGGSNQTTSLTQALGVMEKYIPNDPGEYWLAAGVRFTSFEMLSSFALVSVAFGNQLEIALLGETQLSIPVDPTGEEPNNEKIANVELALEVRIDPAAGDFKASAVLTSNSWILNKTCRLTGGFAFYIWYSGEHEGDFVITLGGYNPSYKPAPWYPNEPRLGINWALSKSLTITGGCYFALTPHAVMAGGSLQILFQLEDWFKAWLTAYIDFLIEWQPFHYEADAGVMVGVSITVSVLGAKITLTVEIGATVYLSGPPFGGTATIHLWIISVTIPFGKTTDEPGALTFDQLNQAVLPKQATKQKTLSIAAAITLKDEQKDDGDNAKQPIFITPSISSGVIASPTSNKNLTMPIVAASTLKIRVTSSWPATELLDGSNRIPNYPGKFSTTLYARPMHDESGFNSTLSVQVTYKGDGQDHTGDFVLRPILKNAPMALWTKWDKDGPALNTTPDSKGDPTLTIPDVPFGISLRAGSEKDLDPSAQIPLENFASESASITVTWPNYHFADPPKNTGDGLKQIADTIVDVKVVAMREDIRKKLCKAGTQNLPLSVVISPELSQQPDNVFLAVPEIANLGQIPSANARRGVEQR